MTAIGLLFGVIVRLVNQPGVRDVLSQAGKAIVRQATASIIRHVQEKTRRSGGGIQTVR